MSRSWKWTRIALAALLAVGFLPGFAWAKKPPNPPPPVPQIAYSITLLRTLGGESSSAARINRLGDIVGRTWTAPYVPHGRLTMSREAGRSPSSAPSTHPAAG